MAKAASSVYVGDAYLEVRQEYPGVWANQWASPNLFLANLPVLLKSSLGVDLADFSFREDVKNLAETEMKIALRQLGGSVHIGLNWVNYVIQNPKWALAEEYVQAFQTIASGLSVYIDSSPLRQEATLLIHMDRAKSEVAAQSQSWVSATIASGWDFCGISLHNAHRSLSIEPSLRFRDGVFLKLSRVCPGEMSMAEIAKLMLVDEVEAFHLMGYEGLP